MFSKLKNYINESKTELSKVSWPTKKETLRLTGTVIAVSLAIGMYLGGLDYMLSKVLKIFVSIG